MNQQHKRHPIATADENKPEEKSEGAKPERRVIREIEYAEFDAKEFFRRTKEKYDDLLRMLADG